MSECPKSATRQTLLLLAQSNLLCCAAAVVSPLSHQTKGDYQAVLLCCPSFAACICSCIFPKRDDDSTSCQLCQIKKVHEGKIWMRLPCTENQNISNQQKHWSLIGHRTISESIRVSCNSSDQSQTTYGWTIKTGIIMEYSYFFNPLDFSTKTYSDSNIPRHPPFFFSSQKMPGCTCHPTVSQSSSQQTFFCRHVGQYCRPFTGTTHRQDQPVPSLKHRSPPLKSIIKHQRQ